MGSGRLHEFTGDGIALLSTCNNGGCEAGVIAGAGVAHPAYNSIGIGAEPFEQGSQQVCPIYQAVAGPQRPTQGFASQPGPAALVGKRESPTADAKFAGANDAPPDAPGADDDDAAIAAGVCADACGPGVACKDGSMERQRRRSRLCKSLGLASSRQGKTGNDSTISMAGPCLLQTLRGGLTHG
jgi:hypothetical protein